MEIIIQPTRKAGSLLGAGMVAALVRRKPRCVLGLATGRTPLDLYRELIRLHKEEGLDFSGVTTFNLDEYVGLPPQHPASYHHFMQEHLFEHLNLRPGHTYVPDGMAADVQASCERYEMHIRAAEGIDLQLLGIGCDGHLGFNEPSSSLASRTRIKTLMPETIETNRRFFSAGETVPHHVITMGLGTILEAASCLLLAFGAEKAEAVAAMVEGPVTATVPASILQMHPQVTVIVDEEATRLLKRSDYYRHVYANKPAFQHENTFPVR